MARLQPSTYRIQLPARTHVALTEPPPRPWLAPFLLSLVGTVAAAFVVMEAFGLRYVQTYTCPEMRKVRFFQTEVTDPAVVFLGNSQMHYGVMPPIVAGCAYAKEPLTGYNLALPGAPLDLTYILMRDLLQARRKPRIIVLGVMPLALESGGRREPELLFRYGSLDDIARGVRSGELPATDLVAGAFRGVENLLQAPFQQIKKPIRPYRHEHLELSLGGWWSPANIADAVAIPEKNWDRMLAKLGERGEPQSFTFTDDSTPAQQLLAIRDLAEKRGIRLVLAEPPQHPDCDALFYAPDTEARYRAWLEAFCRKERLVYWDFDDPEAYVQGDFADPVHLNARGAAKFSRRLAERLSALSEKDRPLVESPQPRGDVQAAQAAQVQ